MPIATKNNAIILKNGMPAEACTCCGVTCESLAARDELTLSVACEDRILYRVETVTGRLFGCSIGQQRGFTGLFPGNDYAGTFTLSKVSSGVWQYLYPTTAPTCPHPYNSFSPTGFPNSRLRLTHSGGCSFNLLVSFISLIYCDYGQAQQRSRGDFDCIERTSNGSCQSGSVYSAVNFQYALNLNQSIVLNLSGSGPFSLWSGQVAGPFVCSGPSESVSGTTTTTGSGAVSVSLLV